MDANADVEIHPADPNWRRQLLWWALGAFVACALLLLLYQWGIGRMRVQLASREIDAAIATARWLGGGIFAMLALGCGGLSWLCARTASLALAQDRFPPRQARLTRAQPVLHGEPARRRARLLQMIAALLPLVALLSGLLMFQLLTQLR